jgi:hypothetical protein
MRIVWMFLLLGCACWAQGVQNMELSWLVGGIHTSAEDFPGTTNNLEGSVGFVTEVGYAYQLPKPQSGYLWLEVPVTFTWQGSGTIVGSTISSLDRDTIYLAPGLRLKTPTYGRVSFYAAAGGGLGLFNSQISAVNGTSGGVISNFSIHPHPVADFAGGIDLRLSRLLSLRGQVRIFVSSPGLGGISGSTHPTALIGLTFHL